MTAVNIISLLLKRIVQEETLIIIYSLYTVTKFQFYIFNLNPYTRNKFITIDYR